MAFESRRIGDQMTNYANQEPKFPNKVTGHWWDVASRLGAIEINQNHFGLYKIIVGYNARGRAMVRFAIRAAYDWNMSNVFWMQSNSIKALVNKIEKCEHLLVK